jgi:hypothetical protein
MKSTVYIGILTLVLFLCLGAVTFKLDRQIKENRRINENVVTMASYLQMATDSLKTDVRVINMKTEEVRKAFPGITTQLNQLNIKLKNVESVGASITEINSEFRTFLKDSIILDTVPMQYVRYNDPWLSFHAEIIDKEFIVKENLVTDSLLQVVHWSKESGFPFGLGWFKKKYLVQTIRASNPNAVFKYDQFIRIEK